MGACGVGACVCAWSVLNPLVPWGQKLKCIGACVHVCMCVCVLNPLVPRVQKIKCLLTLTFTGLICKVNGSF